MSGGNEPAWHYDPVTDEHKAAMAWHVTTVEWDALPPEHQGRMLEIYKAQRTQRNWEYFVNRPKG